MYMHTQCHEIYRYHCILILFVILMRVIQSYICGETGVRDAVIRGDRTIIRNLEKVASRRRGHRGGWCCWISDSATGHAGTH